MNRRFRVVALIAIMATTFAAMSPSLGEDLPSDLERKDYIAYLTLSDMVRQEFRDSAGKPIVACISTADDGDGVRDDGELLRFVSEPNPKLLSVLSAAFTREFPNLVFKPASDCANTRQRVKERSSGQPALIFYAYPLDSFEMDLFIERIGCKAQVAAGWHAGALSGNGYYYQLIESSGYVAIERSLCRSAE